MPCRSALPAGAAGEDVLLGRREQIRRCAIAWHGTHRAEVNEGCRASGTLPRPSERRPSVRGKYQGYRVDFLGAGLRARYLGNVAWAGCGRAGSEDPPPDCAIHPPKNSTAADNCCLTRLPCAKLKQPRLPAGRSGNSAYFDRWLWHSYHLSDNEPKESRRAAAYQTGSSITFRSMRLDRHAVPRA